MTLKVRGAGLLRISDLADIARIVHCFHLLMCDDQKVAEFAKRTLEDVQTRKLRRAAKTDNPTQYRLHLEEGLSHDDGDIAVV